MKEYFCCITYQFIERVQKYRIGYKATQKLKMLLLGLID